MLSVTTVGSWQSLNGCRKWWLGVHVQKKLVLSKLKEAYHDAFLSKKIGFSKLRPPKGVLAGGSGTHSVSIGFLAKHFGLFKVCSITEFVDKFKVRMHLLQLSKHCQGYHWNNSQATITLL